MAQIPISDFYTLLRDAVRLFPARSPVKKCAQLQAFRVLQAERGAEVMTENLGATVSDKGGPFFYSRAWEAAKFNPNNITFDWPILTVFETVNETNKSAFEKGFKRCYTLEISVLDIYREDCQTKGAAACDARPVNQIYLDTETLLNAVLKYMGRVVIATTSADPAPKYYNEDWLIAKVTAGDITAYTIRPGGEVGQSLIADNQQMTFSRVEFSAQKKIHGTKAQIKFCTYDCTTVSFNLSAPEFGVLAFEAGCSDCQ